MMEEYLIKNELQKDYEDDERIWTVYVHIVPKEFIEEDWDMYYVGVTSRKPKERWGSNGDGYRTQYFGKIIKDVGWDNIQHEVIAQQLTIYEARDMECTLIDKLDSFGEHGYNKDQGGGVGDPKKEREDLTNKIIGRWHVLHKDPNIRGYYICQCSCENQTIRSVNGYNLEHDISLSCGCINKERMKMLKYNHGMAGTKLHQIWAEIKKKRRKGNVCEKWKNDFIAFHEWSLENGYKEGLVLDRINKEEDWGPDNCRWVLPEEREIITSRTIILTYKNKTQSLRRWIKELGLDDHIIEYRLKQGMSVEDAFEKPIFKPKIRKTDKFEYHGVTKTIEQWADTLNIQYKQFYNKIYKYKYDVKKALDFFMKEVNVYE